ncbi:hypothetical protein BSKO_13703 [Bryopsis sp. KO-2023]|nr:hypothetical protein BSKO_13703 [Bryopsis sp. KO-2023]
MTSLREDQAPEENVQLLVGLRNPVLRTYLFPADQKNWKRYWLLVFAFTGVAFLTVGPILGSLIIPKSARQDAILSQLITPDDTCFGPENSSQACDSGAIIEYYLFNVTNPAAFLGGTTPPALQVVGPFSFDATDVNQDVEFSQDQTKVARAASYYQEFSQDSSCQACSLDDEITLLNKEYLEGTSSDMFVTRTVKAVLAAVAGANVHLNYNLTAIDDADTVLDVLALRPHHKTMYTGWGDHEKTTRVFEYETKGLPEPHGVDGGRVFGPGFDSKENQILFDSWVADTVELELSQSGTKVEGIETDVLEVVSGGACTSNLELCPSSFWNITSRFGFASIATLPFFLGTETAQSTGWMNSISPDDTDKYKWRLYVEPTFGLAVRFQSTYQLSHLVVRDGAHPNLWEPVNSSGLWIPTHWINVTYVVRSGQRSHIISSLRKLKIAHFLCNISLPVLGAIFLVIVIYQFFFTAAAKARYRTMKILLRSRARDPKLNPAQFNALRHFMTDQMKKARRTKRTDEVGEDQKLKPKKVKSTSSSAAGKDGKGVQVTKITSQVENKPEGTQRGG